MIAAVVILFFLGAVFGSFAGAVVWRTRRQASSRKPPIRRAQGKQASSSKQFSILTGRSQCEVCQHALGPLDLVPVFSWLALRGRCRYCGQKIAVSNLLIELALGAVFATSYIFWPQTLAGGQWLLFATWLAASVGLAALAFYDLKWMLLPNNILYPTFFIVLLGRLGYILFFAADKAHDIWLLSLSISVASGIFLMIYVGSQGRLIGYGDVRLGLVSGTILASPMKSFLMIFLASVLGTIAVLPELIRGKKSLSARLPYGPFLIAATAVVLLFGDSMASWYEGLLR